MLLDSNIIIYAAKPQYQSVRDFVAKHAPVVSAVSYVEVLGYHRLTELEREYFGEFFRVATMLQITPAVLEHAIKIRQLRKMSLGDALIAATALVHGKTLVTRNTDDFSWIAGLVLLNPID